MFNPDVAVCEPAASAWPGYRVLNGEGEGLPGLVCDVYGDTAVFKLDGDGPAGFYNVQAISKWLSEQLPQLRTCLLKHRYAQQQATTAAGRRECAACSTFYAGHGEYPDPHAPPFGSGQVRLHVLSSCGVRLWMDVCNSWRTGCSLRLMLCR